MLLFSTSQFDDAAQNLLKEKGVKRGRHIRGRYENGEHYVRLETKVGGRVCALLGSVGAPDDLLTEFLLTAHTLKKEKAKKVIALLPYLGYARHDKEVPGLDLGTQWIGGLLKASGVDEIRTLDIHSYKDSRLIRLPLKNYSTEKQLLSKLEINPTKNYTVLAPDEGAIDRAKRCAQEASIKNPVAYIKKKRTLRGIRTSKIQGRITKDIIIVDDILDTGETILHACKKLHALKIDTIQIAVTHGLFTTPHWRQYKKYGVKRVVTTDSTPTYVKPKANMIHTVSVVNNLIT